MAGTPIVNPQQRALQLAQVREQFKDDPGIFRKLVQGLVELPHKAWETGEMPSTPQSMAYSLNALSGGMAGAAARGGSSLGIFGGKMAKTANTKMLKVAEDLESAGVDRDAIWQFTGWGRGKDKQWRFEIPDRPSHLWTDVPERLQEGTITLSPYRKRPNFSHPELYEAYPELRDMRVLMEPRSSGFGGTYHRSTPENRAHIQILAKPGMGSVMLHELQHAVQQIEGFAPGSNPNRYSGIVDAAKIGRVDEAINLVTQRSDAIWGKGLDITPEKERELQALMDVSTILHKLKDDVRRRASPMEQYRRSAGETEARNVQKRMLAEPSNLRLQANAPWHTEDVPRPLQTIND